MTDHTPGTGDTDPIEALSTAACWALLEAQNLGRLALLDLAGDPEVFPVNYATFEGSLYIRTANDSKLRHQRAHATVAFEIDGDDGDAWWSVVVRGAASQLMIDDEVRRSGIALLRTASPTAKPYFLRLEPSAITGRRFRNDAPGGPREEAPDAEEQVPRSTRPNPIPHRRPFGE